MIELFKQGTIWLAAGVEAVAALVIGLAALEAAIRALWLFVPGRKGVLPPQQAKEAVRLQLGRWLAVALEFELAADVLRTAVAPTWTEIGQLGAIAVLRTALNYFLQQEAELLPAAGNRQGRGTAPRLTCPGEERFHGRSVAAMRLLARPTLGSLA